MQPVVPGVYIKNSAIGWIEPVAVRNLLTQTAEMYERGANHPATLIFAGVWFEADHMNQTVYDSYGFDALLEFVEQAQLDWCGFFAYSAEEGTFAYDLGGQVDRDLAVERLYELNAMQDTITALKRDALVGSSVEVLVDSQGTGRSFREAPEIDGIITVPTEIPVGDIVQLTITGSLGPDLEAS